MNPAPRPFAASASARGMRWSRSLAALLSTVAIAACGTPTNDDPGQPAPDSACNPGAQRDCYDGPEGTFGVGPCTSGIQTCVDGKWGECVGSVTPKEEVCNGVDDNCDGTIDEGVTNACGGCEELPFIPGESCEECGVWQCANGDSLVCVGGEDPTSSSCLADNGCGGTLRCNSTGATTCEAVEFRNACNVCGGPELDGLKETCTTADGCEGVWECDDAGTSLVCVSTSKNNCGVCGAENVTDLTESCVASNGCEGTRECDGSGTGSVCVTTIEKNECGLCNGPGLPDLGDGCEVNGCQGTWICSDTRDALICDSEGRNNCAACNAPDVPDIGTACVDHDGCAGTSICDDDGTGSTCLATIPVNQCGECAPPVSGLEEACADDFQCPGITECDEAGTGIICSVTRPTGVGSRCFDANGCQGVFHCDKDGGVACIASGCDGPVDHVVISQLSVGRTGGNNPTNQFIELYNPTDEPFDLTQLEIWIGGATGSNTHPPPALSNRACVACDGDMTNSCGEESGGWSPACAGNAVIQPRGYFLIGRGGGYSGTPQPDAVIGVNLPFNADPNETGGQVWLFDGKPLEHAPVVDMVGYGPNSAFAEGDNPASLHSTALITGPQPPLQSIVRKAFESSTAESMGQGGEDVGFGNGVDRDDNGSDFVIRTVRNPRNSTSPSEPVLPTPDP